MYMYIHAYNIDSAEPDIPGLLQNWQIIVNINLGHYSPAGILCVELLN